MVYNQKIASLTNINDDDEFTLAEDGINRNLKQFIEEFPYVYLKNGVWNNYEKTQTKKAIEICHKSPYGGNIYISYNHAWAMGETNGFCQINIECPSYGDMF